MAAALGTAWPHYLLRIPLVTGYRGDVCVNPLPRLDASSRLVAYDAQYPVSHGGDVHAPPALALYLSTLPLTPKD